MAGNEIKGEMIRGHVDTFILLSLCNGDKDSNEIKEAIEERSDNKFTAPCKGSLNKILSRNIVRALPTEFAENTIL